MPKAPKNSKLGRVARRVAAAAPLPPLINKDVGREKQDEEPDAHGKQDLSRGQRRRLAKREQYFKREKMILTSLKLRSQEEQKGRIDGLDAIREALIGTTKDADKVEKEEDVSAVKSEKGKKRLVIEEVHHMGLVLQHPAFQADPFASIQEHLRNTLAQDRKRMELEAQERTKDERRKKENQKQEKKDRLQGVKKSKKKFKATRSRS